MEPTPGAFEVEVKDDYPFSRSRRIDGNGSDRGCPTNTTFERVERYYRRRMLVQRPRRLKRRMKPGILGQAAVKHENHVLAGRLRFRLAPGGLEHRPSCRGGLVLLDPDFVGPIDIRSRGYDLRHLVADGICVRTNLHSG